jgi:mevalonate kinase
MTSVSAPAKVILFGEHAVVHGRPAIAVPVSSLRATATIHPNDGHPAGLRIKAADLNQVLPVDLEADLVDNALTTAARLVLEAREQPAPEQPAPDVTIVLSSTIPMASGLGSGAAVSAALMRAVAAACEIALKPEDLNRLVYEVEKIFHGTPSGIDNTVVVYEKPVYYIKGHPIQTLDISQPFTLVIGDTGQTALTRVAVGDVRALVEADPDHYCPILDEIGEIAQRARATILAGDIAQLGPLMNRNHALLQELTVSSELLDRLVNAARSAGALGAKLSGGGRGGNMIALVMPETAASVAQALQQAGAAQVFTTTVQN